MKKFGISVGAFLIALIICWTGSISAQEKTCKIVILSPKKGDEVRLKGEKISGRASVPAGMHLWVFSQKEGQHNWWPQGGGSVSVKGSEGKWVVDATFGDESNPSKDAGANFNITAAAIDDATQTVLKNYIKTTEDTGRYPGVELPAVPPGGCSVKEDDEVTVTRR